MVTEQPIEAHKATQTAAAEVRAKRGIGNYLVICSNWPLPFEHLSVSVVQADTLPAIFI